MRSVTDMTVPLPGGQLMVQDAGPPDGLPVLVYMGSPGSRHLSPAAVRLAGRKGLRLIGVDPPGYGGSTAQPGRRVADSAADTKAIADALGITRLAVWGISGGGPVALACAALLPGLVFAACVFASLGPYGEPGLDFLDFLSEAGRDEARLFFADRPLARERFRADAAEQSGQMSVAAGWLEHWGDQAEADAAHSREVAEWLALCWRDGMRDGDQGWWDDWASYLQPWGFDLSTIRVPVQLWHGLGDASIPAAHAKWLADRIPGVDAHFPAGDDHGTIEANHASQAYDWLIAVGQETFSAGSGKSPETD
jgi:pimeloyl-ACP methyl ester carboxylesterase